MIIRHDKPFAEGLNLITREEDKRARMDFGILSLKAGARFESAPGKERVLLLIEGSVRFTYEGKRADVSRVSFLNEGPVLLHLPAGTAAGVQATAESELACAAVMNGGGFEARLYGPEDCESGQFGKDLPGGAALRDVRTVLDDGRAPWSNLVLGEIVNHPGKWSSYPPHHHVQPEVYYYRLSPSQGFGYSGEGNEVSMVRDRDAALITPGLGHPQAAAPGYAMYYAWVIPHSPRRWRNERTYLEQHAWLLEKSAAVWPDRRD